MLEIIKMINSDYAGVLSLLSSVIMVIVTIIYVGYTKRQANYAKESVELVAKQMKTEKQPCIVPHVVDSNGVAFDATEDTRIQLGFEVNLKNVGDAPAINIYTLADIELQFTNDTDGDKELLSAALLPKFVQALSVGEETKIHVHFETAEVKAMVKELRKAMDKNWERLRTVPTHHHYTGANLIIRVLFKNIMGQWGESAITYEIPWLAFKDPPLQKTHNLNENTIPPKRIREGDEFKAVLSSPHIAPFSFEMMDNKKVKAILETYTDESPWLNSILEKDFTVR